MKIVHLVGWYFPSSLGGTEIYVRELARAQRNSGHEVFVAAPDATRSDAATYEHAATPVFRYPIPASPSRDEAQGLTAVRGTEMLIAWLHALRPTVVHLHSFVTGLGLRELEAARAAGARIVVTHHLPSLGYGCRNGTLMERSRRPCDGIAEPVRCGTCVLCAAGVPPGAAAAIASLPLSMSAMLGRTRGPIGTSLGIRRSIATDLERQRQLFAIADVQVVLNDTALRIFSDNGLPIDRVTVNRLAVSGGPYVRKPAQPPITPVKFGAVSRLHPSKGLSELVRAARSLPHTVAFTLHIRGPLLTAADRAYAGELRRLAGGDGRISIEAGPPHEQIPALLAQYDVVCCVGTGFENGPTVALEALAVGTPLLATAIGNQNEIVEHDVNGWLVTPGDERALAAAIDEIARRPDIITTWQRRLPIVRGMEDVARDYETIYADLVARAAA